MKRFQLAWLAAALGATALAGCEIISGLNGIEAHPAGKAGGTGGTAVTSSTTTTSGTGGTTSSTGGGGSSASAGGGGAKPECSKPDDCKPQTTKCELNTCDAGKCGSKHEMKGVACMDNNGTQCDGAGNCVDGGCVDGQKGMKETDVDCGGSCPKKCANTKGCDSAIDCDSGYCDTGKDPKNGSKGTCSPCSSDGQCGAGNFCNDITTNCAKQKPVGASCTKPSACSNGQCVDGFCCDAKCDGLCQACSNDLTSMPNGQCTILGGVADKGNKCGAYLCNGIDTGCPTTCADSTLCISGDYCDTLGDKKCHVLKKLGDMCSQKYECPTSYCVDATCCAMANCPMSQTCAHPDGKCAP